MAVGDFDADGRFPWNPVDANGFRLDAKAQIVYQAGNSGIFDAGVRLEFEGCHNRAGMDLRDAAVDVKFRAFFRYHARAFHEDRFVDREGVVRRTEQIHGREMKFAGARAIRSRRRRMGTLLIAGWGWRRHWSMFDYGRRRFYRSRPGSQIQRRIGGRFDIDNGANRLAITAPLLETFPETQARHGRPRWRYA